MPKIKVEFINTCPCCDEHVQTIKNVAARYGDGVEVKIYYAGKGFTAFGFISCSAGSTGRLRR